MRVLAAGTFVLGLSACSTAAPESAASVMSVPSASALGGLSMAGPLLAPDGRCTGTPPGTAAAIEPGIGECELVRLKGRPPTDVLVGESGKVQREVQVLYAERGGREIYFFIDNRLDRVLR